MKAKKLYWSLVIVIVISAVVGVIRINHNESASQPTLTGIEATITEGGINKDWGIIILQGTTKNVVRGDTAYVKKLGSSSGLMTVEAVEGDKILVDASNIDLVSLSVSDVIVIQKN